MLTILKTIIDHRCSHCDGKFDVSREEFPTFLGASEAVRMATSLAISMGFVVVDMKPGRVELERTEDDVYDELTMELLADPVAAN